MIRDPVANAHRLRAAADEARARLDALEAARLHAQEACCPGPGPREIDAAREEWELAEAKAAAAAGRVAA